MIEYGRPKLTLHRHATYRIRVPGELDDGWTDWGGKVSITIDRGDDLWPVTTLPAQLDQAALHGLLGRLYSLGLPLLSVDCVDCGRSTSRSSSPR